MLVNNFTIMLRKIQNLMIEATGVSSEVHDCYDKGNIKGAYKKSLELARYGERIALHARKLPVYTGNPKAHHDVRDVIDKEYPVEMGYVEGKWFSLKMPILLPSKKDREADYLKEAFYPSMGRYMSHHYIGGKISEPVVMVFRHVYTEDFPERRKRDHDNYEVKTMTDIVSLLLLVDDGPAHCSHYYCTAVGDEERTEIYVIPKREFAEWIAYENTIPKEGVKLYERPKKA